MKLRVGGKYKTRDGLTVGPMEAWENLFECAQKEHGLDRKLWSGDGIRAFSDPEYNLVEEVFDEDTQVIDSVMEATSKANDDPKETYIKILEAMLTQKQLDTAGRILGNLSKS